MPTLNLQVAASADDALEFPTGVTWNNTVYLTIDAAGEIGGARWAASVPQGATISSATLQVYLDSTSYDDPVSDVYGFDEDTTAAFPHGAGQYGISSRDTTTATVAFDGSGLGAGWQSITVTAIVQEIVSRPGWSSGNYLGMSIVADTGCNLRIIAYEGNSSLAPKLDITYSVGVPRHAMYYARARA